MKYFLNTLTLFILSSIAGLSSMLLIEQLQTRITSQQNEIPTEARELIANVLEINLEENFLIVEGLDAYRAVPELQLYKYRITFNENTLIQEINIENTEDFSQPPQAPQHASVRDIQNGDALQIILAPEIQGLIAENILIGNPFPAPNYRAL